MANKLSPLDKLKRTKKILIGCTSGLGATTIAATGVAIYFALRPQVETFKVTIKNVSGATIYGGTEQKVVSGTLIGQLPTPFKSDMIFDCWQDSSKKNISNQTPITSDMEVYASWKTPTLDAHTVSFNLDGGEFPGLSGTTIKVNDKTLVGKLPSPTKKGYIFEKWQKNGVDLPFTYEITSDITIKAIYKVAGESATLSDGSRLLEIKSDATGSDTNTWVLKDAEGKTVNDPEWSIVNKIGGTAITGLTIASGKVSWANVTTGSYTAVITAEAKDGSGIQASTEIGVSVTDPVYALSGGTTQASAKLGIGGSFDNAWTLSKDGNIVTPDSWTVTKPDGTTETSITAPNGKLTWTADTPVNNYDLKIHAIVNTKDVAQIAVGLIINENDYVLSGGTRGFSVKPGETVTDSNTWTLTKDTAAVTSPSLSIEDITPSITSPASITIANGKVTCTRLPENSYTFNVVATVDGKKVVKEQVSVISTETYEITYGDGTIGTSLTIKDNATAVDSNGFILKDSTATVEGVTWDLTKPSKLTDAQLKFDATKTNCLSYANVPTGTYNLTITAKIGDTAKASIPFTLTSQDTKISLVIAGSDTINIGDSLTAEYDTNLADKTRVSWDAPMWTGNPSNKPTISVDLSTGVCTVTAKNAQMPEGNLTIKATDSISGQTATKTITVNVPYTGTNKVFTYDGTNQWCSVPMSDLTGTGTITKTTLGGTKLDAIERVNFNDAVYIGDKVTSIPANFLNGCTSFNSTIKFSTTSSECSIIGNNFMSGCSVFNKELVLPNTIQIIGDNFLEECVAFNNGGTVTTFAMPTSLTSIGDMFLYDCQSFNQAITIAATVTSIGNDFMYNCYAMVATITINADALNFKATGATPLTLACNDYTKACYNLGITLAGDSANLDNFKAVFPEITATATGIVCRNYK